MSKKLNDQMWEEIKRLEEYCDLLEKMIMRGDAEELGKMRELLLGEKAFKWRGEGETLKNKENGENREILENS